MGFRQTATGAALLAAALTGTAMAAGPPAPEQLEVESRAFGKLRVTAEYPEKGGSILRYRAATPELATRTASKRLADLTGFGDIRRLPGPETVLELPGTGFWKLGTTGDRFVEIFAPNRAALDRLSAKAGKLAPVPERAYPRYLDGFDQAGPSFWVGGGGDNYQLPNDFEWLKARRFGFCTLPPTQGRLVAPGVVDTAIFDWHAAMARKYDLPYRQLLFPAAFEWSWNQTPLPYAIPMKDFVSMPYLHYMTQATAGGEEPIPQTDRYRWDLRRRLVETVGRDPNLIGWHGCTEIPDARVSHLAGLAGMPSTRKLYREYLQKTLKLDLAAVGKRYHNNPNFYKSWDDVTVPVPTDFLNYRPDRAIDLAGTWEFQPDRGNLGMKAEWFKPDQAPADGWGKIAHNDPMILMYQNNHHKRQASFPFWMRRTFTVPAGKTPAAYRYLHIARAGYHGSGTRPFRIWVNGTACPELKSSGNPSLCYDLAPGLRAGANTIVLDTGGQPIPGFIFANDTPLRPYPHMTPAENQAWFDAVNFSAFLRVRKIEDDLKSVRAADPVRPLKMMATINLLDLTTPLAKQYGAYQHDTGGAGGYWCPMTGAKLARSHGFAWSCEQGGPPRDAKSFQSQVTYYLMYGNDAVDFVFGVGHYTKKPDVAAWVDKNLELLHCIGKMTLPPQKIALLRSSRATRLGFSEPWNWDLGRGPLQAAGRTYVYLEVPDLLDPATVDRYPIILDAGTVVLTPEECRAIRRYVENGGIFVTQHHTGRHSPDRADSWPLAAEFGLTVRDKAINAENYHRWPLAPIKFEQKQDLFPRLRGATIEGSGVALDYLNQSHTGAASVSGAAAVPIARWDDGSMAVAEVRAGKGRFLFMGSPFFYRMKDANGVWLNDAGRNALLDEMLSALGAPRETRADGVWAECWESKNGVYDLYPVARMPRGGADEIRTAPAVRRSSPVRQIVEVSALNHPAHPVRYEKGMLQLPELPYTPMQTRVFIAPRADVERAGLRWIRNQSEIWHPVAKVAAPGTPVTPDPNVLPLDGGWRISADYALENEFFKPGFDAKAWKTVKLGTLATMGFPENARVLCRREIALPSGWTGQTVTLTFDSHHWFWGLTPHCQLWINGVPAKLKQPIKPQAAPSFTLDVTPEAATGKLVLALAIDGTQGPKPPQQQTIPHGASGLFYLRRLIPAVKALPLEHWNAGIDLGKTAPVKVGKRRKHVFFETRFELPVQWPAPRVFLRTPQRLGGIVLNGKVLDTPSWMNELDISGMVRRNGENHLYWAPQGLSHNPLVERVVNDPLPPMELVFKK